MATQHGKKLPEVRITGTPEQVESIHAEMANIYELEDESRDYPRRGEQGRVSRYIKIRRIKQKSDISIESSDEIAP